MRRRYLGVAFALLGLTLATIAAVNLGKAAQAGHPFVPPWVVVIFAGAGLVSAAGYLAWAGSTPVSRESERWTPTPLDVAAGLTADAVPRGAQVLPPAQKFPAVEASSHTSLAHPSFKPGESPSDHPRPASTTTPPTPGPKPMMGTSTLDQDSMAPAGVAGAVGGFLLAAAIVCAVLALILPTTPYLIASAVLAVGGVSAVHVAGAWLRGF